MPIRPVAWLLTPAANVGRRCWTIGGHGPGPAKPVESCTLYGILQLTPLPASVTAHDMRVLELGTARLTLETLAGPLPRGAPAYVHCADRTVPGRGRWLGHTAAS